MKDKLYLFIICCSHFMLAWYGYLPIYIAGFIGSVVALLAMKKWTFTLDWSVIVHLGIYSVYILNGATIQNFVLLIASLLLMYYSASKQQKLAQSALVQLEVNEKLEAFNDTFQEVRKERHDYLKHVAAISYMLENEQLTEAKDYMRTVVKRYEQTNLSIKGEQGAVAAILYTNYEKARSYDIAINYLLEVPISNLPLSSDQIVQLIGNLLENAIDASIEWQATYNKQAVIELSIRKKSGLYILTCVNNTVPLANEIADQLFTKSGVTTKANHSGLGTSIIQQIVGEHNGYLDFTIEKQTFTVTCKIPHVVA